MAFLTKFGFDKVANNSGLILLRHAVARNPTLMRGFLALLKWHTA